MVGVDGKEAGIRKAPVVRRTRNEAGDSFVVPVSRVSHLLSLEECRERMEKRERNSARLCMCVEKKNRHGGGDVVVYKSRPRVLER